MKKLALIAATLGLMTFAIPQAASADPVRSSPPPVSESHSKTSAKERKTVAPVDRPRNPGTAALTPADTGKTSSDAMALAAATSPAGCKGKTDYAHRSGDDASVHGRTECNYNVPEVQVTTTLQRHR